MEEHDEAIQKEVKQQLWSLFKNLYDGSPMQSALAKNWNKIVTELDKFHPTTDLFRISIEKVTNLAKKSENPKEYKKTVILLYVFTYLSLVETIGNNLVNLALLLLIAEGHDIHLAPDKQHSYVRHVATFEELDSPTISLAIKLDMLNSLGYPVFSKWINRELRNRIAHLDFEIDELGNFFTITKSGKKRKFDLIQEMIRFLDYSTEISDLFKAQLEKLKS